MEGKYKMGSVEAIDMERKPMVNHEFAGEEVAALEKAKSWVMKTFEQFIVYEEDAPDEARIMEFDHIITEANAAGAPVMISSVDAIRTSPMVGTRNRHWIQADKLARLFFAALDNDVEDKIPLMMEYDAIHNLNHARFFRGWRERGLI